MNIQRCMNELDGYGKQKCTKESITNIQRLNQYFGEGNGGIIIDDFCEVFNETNGIITFMRSLNMNESSDEGIYVEILSFFTTLVNQYENHISPYLSKIVNGCKGIFDPYGCTKPNVVVKTCEFLIQIVEMQRRNLSDDTINNLGDIVDRARIFIEENKYSRAIQKAFEFIGLMIENFPENFMDLKASIFRLVITRLNETMAKLDNRSENSSSSIVDGCFIALDPMLTHYGFISEKVNEHESVYNNLKKVLALDDSPKIYGTKACLNVLKNNCHIFFELMYSDYKSFWSETLYTKQKSSHLNKLVVDVLHSFYSCVSTDSNRSILYEQFDVLQFILNEMKTMAMESEDNRLLMLAIATLGKLANVCKDHKQFENIDIFKLLLDILEEIRLRSHGNVNVADFLCALSQAARGNSHKLSEDHMVIFEQLSIEIVESYPNLYKEKQAHARKSLVKFMFNIAACSTDILDRYLTSIVYIGIIKSCRHLLDEEIEFLKEISDSSEIEKAVSYRAYVSLWTDLCAVENITDLDSELTGGVRCFKPLIATSLYDKFVQTVLEIMHKLDLNPDLDNNVRNTNIKTDHLVFLNLVDLFVSVIPSTDLDRFKRWIPSFISYITTTHTTFKSGFYKLFTMIFQVGEKVNYFNDSTLLETEIQVICKFLTNVLLHIQQYVGMDLVCCLYLVIHTPGICVSAILPHLDIVYKMIFTVGLTDLQLIQGSLSALVRWKSCLSADEFSRTLKCVLPNVITILQIREFSGDAIQTTKYEADLLKPIFKVRKTKSSRTFIQSNKVTQIQKLQREIVIFLGKISTEACLAALKSDVIELWNSTENLSFNLPFEDMKILLHLDSLFPNIIDLALHSADYRTRITACELLHGCTIMLAKKCSSYTTDNDTSEGLFRKVVIVVFKLGSETNVTIEQLFRPLSFQLVHFYTSSSNPFAGIILDIIYDGIINDCDGMLRRFCLECLTEFVQWPFKSSTANRKLTRENVKIVIERICMYCVNPSASRRLGGALAFNSIYVILREHEYIVDEFWLELLYKFVCSLKLNNNEIEDDACISALSHVKRVLSEKSEFFKTPSNIRIKPAPFEGVTLNDAVFWLFSNCASYNFTCRKQCMDLISTLMPEISDDHVAEKCVSILLQTESFKVTIDVVERKILTTNDLASIDEHILQHVLVSFDCLVWLLRDRRTLISDVGLQRFNTRFVPLMECGAQYVRKNVKSIADYKYSVNNSACDTNDRIIFKIFELVTVLENDFSAYLDIKMFCDDTLNVIVEYLFNPPLISNVQEDRYLQETLTNLLLTLGTNLDAATQYDFASKLLITSRSYQNGFKTTLSRIVSKETNIPLESRQYLKALFILYNSRFLFTPYMEKLVVPNFTDLIFDTMTAKNIAVTPLLTDLSWLENVLEFSLLHNKQVNELIAKLSDSTKIKSEGTTDRSVTKGEHFLSLFKKPILDHLLRHQTAMFNKLFDGDSDDRANYEQRIRVFRSCLQHLQCLKQHNVNYDITELKRCIHSRWHFFRDFVRHDEQSVRLVLNVIADIVSVEKKGSIGCLRNDDYLVIFHWVLFYLKSKTVSKFVKSKLLDLLPSLCSHEYHPNYDDNLLDALNILKEEYFPSISSGLIENSGEYITYKVLFSKILYALESSCSPTILRYIVDVVSNDPEHILQQYIFTSFQHFVAKLSQKLSAEKQFDILSIPFDISQTKPENTLGIVELCLVPMLLMADSTAAKLFFVNKIENMWTIINKPFQTNSQFLKTEITSKLAVCILIETMCICIPSEISASNSELIRNPEKKHFAGEIAECMSNILDRGYNIEIKVKEKQCYRKLLCAAYNVYIALARYVKRNITILNRLKSVVFERIVEVDKRFRFSMQPEELPKRNAYFVRKRKELKNTSLVDGGTAILSQYLSYSSLAEDVSKFDMTGYHVRSEVFINQEDDESEASVKLEMIDFNDHECMQQLCDSFRFAHEESKQTTFPEWMKYIRDVLCSSSFGNVKLFIIKAIYNCNHVFKPHAHEFLQPIMDVIKSDNKYFGNDMNYFLADTIIMLLEWSRVARPTNKDGKKSASEVLSMLISMADSNNTSIFNYNMDLIEFYIKEWSSCLDEIPFDLIKEQPRKILFRLTKCFLSNNIVPFYERNETVYIGKLLVGIREELNNFARGFFGEQIVKFGFESFGKILKHLKENINDSNANVKLLNHIAEQLVKILDDVNISQLLDYLKLLMFEYSEIFEKFTNRIVKQFESGSASLKVRCLKIFADVPLKLNVSVFYSLEFNKLQTCLRENNHELQIATLKFIKKFVDRLDNKTLLEFCGDLESVSNNTNTECRFLVYKIMEHVYTRCNNSESDKTLLVNCKNMLIKGTFDNDADVQDFVIKFWKNELKHTPKIVDRLKTMFDFFYMPDIEDLFLSYAIYLLLDASSLTPDYQSKVFIDAKPICSYEDQKMVSSWRTKHSCSAALIKGSVINRLSLMSCTTAADSVNFQIKGRANNFVFQPTINSLDKSENVTGNQPTRLLPTFTSSVFTVTSDNTSATHKYALREKEPVTSSSSTIKSDKEDESERSHQLRKLKQRLPSDNTDRVKQYFASRNIRRNEQREIALQEREQKKEASVKFYRTYRTGHYPDIEIKHSDIIRPLQALARRNPLIAKEMLVLLFDGVCSEKFTNNNEAFVSIVNHVVNKVLLSETRHESSLLTAILKIAYNHLKYPDCSAELISSVSQLCGQPALGCLLLEKMLTYEEPQKSDSVGKKKANIEETKNDIWTKLARLYDSLEETDIVNGILRNKIKTNRAERLFEAYECQQNEKWKDALELYRQNFDYISLCDATNESLLFNSYSKCAAYLSEWKEVNDVIRTNIKNEPDQLWNHTWCVDHVLPWLFASETQMILRSNFDCHKFSSQINVWLTDENKKPALIDNVGEYLSMLVMYQNNSLKASSICNEYINGLVEEWSYLGSSLESLKHRKVLDLQIISEINNMLEVLNSNTRPINENTNDLLKLWSENLPNENDPLVFWDKRILYRNYFIKWLKTYRSDEMNSDGEFLQNFKKYKLKSRLSIIDCSIHQRNISMAIKHVKKESNEAIFKIYHSKLKLLAGNIMYHHEPEKKLRHIFGAWDLLDDMPPQSDAYDLRCHLFNMYSEILNILHTSKALVLYDCVKESFNKRFAFFSNNTDDIVNELQRLMLANICPTAEEEEKHGRFKNASLIYLSIAKYYEKRENKDDVENVKLIIRCILRAMKYDLPEAYQLFPTLLQLPKLDDQSVRKEFIEESAEVEEWKFLTWVNQLMAYVDTDLAAMIKQILIRIATSYPQSLQLVFLLSSDTFSGTNSDSIQLENELRSRLTRDYKLQNLLGALSYVCLPHIMLKSRIEKLAASIKNNFQDFETIVKSLVDDLFEENKMRGILYKPLKICENIIKVNLVRASNEKNQDIALNEIDSLNDLVKKIGYGDGDNFLEHYSPWFANCSSEDLLDLELPGQYTGLSKPMPEYHVKIFSFKPTVKVIPSIRHPIKITITGNDAKDYSYLVKFDEDLRQDNRIQQLFKIMNSSMSRDRACQDRKLFLITYEVTPLKSNLGLIQWMEDTISLSEFLTFKFSHNDRSKYEDLLNDLRIKHVKWLKVTTGDGSIDWNNAVLHRDRASTVAHFKTLCERISPFIYRNALLKLSGSLETFLTIRSRFMASYSTMSMCQWILGIGDRHLENIMINLRNGCCVGIDFGHAFGTATECSPVPELIPFRMTPHIQYIMEPLSLTGLIRETMVHCLTALSRDDHILLCTMQVFIREPSVHWQRNTDPLSNLDRNRSTSDIPDIKWYPKKKINSVRCKLQGTRTPANLLCEELTNNSNLKIEYKEKYCQLIRGDESRIRYKGNEECLTPSQQVDHLLDLSTDEYVLGLSYCGLQLWL